MARAIMAQLEFSSRFVRLRSNDAHTNLFFAAEVRIWQTLKKNKAKRPRNKTPLCWRKFGPPNESRLYFIKKKRQL